MFNLKKIDGGIKLLNQLMLFVILGLILLFSAWGLGSEIWSKYQANSSSVTIKATDIKKDAAGNQVQMALHLGVIERIASAKTFIASIEERDANLRLNYDRVKTTKRNVLFIPDSGNDTHLLFDNYGNKIISFHAYPSNDDAKIIVCRYIKNYSLDTNNKKSAMMFLKPDGSGAQTVIEDMDSLLRMELEKDNALSVVYFKNGELINARFSSTTFKPMAPAAVFNLAKSKLESVNVDEIEE
jgi:hypothetical protein